MHMTYPLIEGAYLRDILDQADALRRTLTLPIPANLAGIAARLAGPQPPFVILTGMGSSFHALHPLSIGLAERGIPVAMIETSELIYYSNGLLGPSTILVVVSQSGQSAETLRLLQLNAGRSLIIGVTNNPDSPLGKAANALVTIDAGPESSVSCKTYVSTLLALRRIGDALGTNNAGTLKANLERVIDHVERYLSHWREHVEEARECIADTRHLILAGRGVSLATAGTGGLIIKEAARFPAEGMSAAAFRHGPLEMVNDGLYLLVFEGAERSAYLNRKLVSDVVEVGGCAQLVSPSSHPRLFQLPAVAEMLLPILEILPIQMISLALAAREGVEAGAFTRASKITAVE
jgi:glucosamine--fructose-6-phosphate aminotransferase (isomerizing)